MKELQYSAIVVLGAQVRPDGTPSEALRRRLLLAHARYCARPVPILCCGARGKNEPFAEGDVMWAWLLERGVPEKHAISERASFDTMQNLWNAKKILAERGLCGILLVTSDYHIRRALAICRRYQIPAIGAASRTAPRYQPRKRLREVFAWGKFFLYGLFCRK